MRRLKTQRDDHIETPLRGRPNDEVHQADLITQKNKEFEQLLVELSTAFIGLPPEQVDQAIHRAFDKVGHLLSIDRCSIGRLSTDGQEMIVTHVWMENGSVANNRSVRYPLAMFPNFLSPLLTGKLNLWSQTDARPVELTKEENNFLDTTGIKAFVAIPVIAAESLKICLTFSGFTGAALFDTPMLERLQLLASIIANVLFHKKTELELHQSAAQLNRAQALVHIGHWELDPFTNEVSGSDELFRIFGLQRSECTLDAFVAVIHPDDRDFLLYHIQRGVDYGKSWDIEYRLLFPDGLIKVMHARGEAITDENEKTIRLLGTVQDITQRKQAEELTRYRLKLSEHAIGHSLKELLEEALALAENRTASLVSFFHFVEEDQKTLTLQAWSKRTSGEFCSVEGEGLHYAVEQAGVWVDCMRQKRSVIHNDYASLEHKKGYPEGHAEVIRELVVPVMRDKKIVAILGVGNKPTRYTQFDASWLEHFADIAWEVASRKRAETALGESEERMRSIFGSVPDNLMLLDREHKIQMVNRVDPLLENVELIGTALYQLARPEEQQRIKLILDQVVQNAQEQKYETVYTTHDGHQVYYSSVAAPIIVSGQIRGSVVSSRDVTDRILLEKEKARIEDEFRHSQKMEAIGRLAGGVSHDFNNVLCAITGNIDLIMMGMEVNDPMYESLDAISKAAERASNLTQQLLAFSRKQVIDPKIINLSELIESLHRMLERLIGEDIVLRTISPKQLGLVRVDTNQIEQIILNLVVNARDAMPDGGVLAIEVRDVVLDDEYCRKHAFASPGAYVKLTVSDTGCGMSQDVQSKIFEPFFTTKKQGQGTGLGLAMVLGIVEQNGGRIEVSSQPEQGSTFRVFFSCVHEKSTSSIDTVKVRQPTGGEETILVVEDEEIVRQMAQKLLTHLGYKVLAAGSPGDAIVMVERYEGKIDLLLTDVIMPHLNGRELAKRLLEMRSDIKVLFTSGYTQNVIGHHGVLDEGVQFLSKPYSLNTLGARVRDVLDS